MPAVLGVEVQRFARHLGSGCHAARSAVTSTGWGPGWSPLPWRLAQGFSLNKLFIGGVHKLMTLQRDFVDDFLTKFFGEEMSGLGGPRPRSRKISYAIKLIFVSIFRFF